MAKADQPTQPQPAGVEAPKAPAPSAARGRVLIADDSEITSAVTRQLLEIHGYAVDSVRTGKEVADHLAQGEFDLVCLDVGLPDMTGFEVCRQVRSSLAFGQVPILMVSAYFTDEANVVEGLEAGANDYVRVPYAHVEFLGRVDNLVRLKKVEDRLRAMALEDALTHLGNRTFFVQRARQEMARAVRHRSSLSLALMDIDHFKDINDTHGHQVGDDVLCGISALVQESLRREDVACRWGGDEFAILLVEADLRHARVVMERILRVISETDYSLTGKEVRTSASAGLGQLDPRNHRELDPFVAEVDKALRQAKLSGRSRIVLTR